MLKIIIKRAEMAINSKRKKGIGFNPVTIVLIQNSGEKNTVDSEYVTVRLVYSR